MIQYGYACIILQCWLLNRLMTQALRNTQSMFIKEQKIQKIKNFISDTKAAIEMNLKITHIVKTSMWLLKLCFKWNSTFNHRNYWNVSGPQNPETWVDLVDGSLFGGGKTKGRKFWPPCSAESSYYYISCQWLAVETLTCAAVSSGPLFWGQSKMKRKYKVKSKGEKWEKLRSEKYVIQIKREKKLEKNENPQAQ